MRKSIRRAQSIVLGVGFFIVLCVVLFYSVDEIYRFIIDTFVAAM